MLGALTPGVNFTNTLDKAFTCTDPKAQKKTESLLIVFLGSVYIKAAHRMLMDDIDTKFYRTH